MRRSMQWCGAIVAVGALALAAAAAAATLASASGSGHIVFGSSSEHTSFNAQRHSDGSATGQAEVVDHTASGTVRFHLDVDCLNVVGNTATISGIVTSSSDPTIVGFEGIFQVVDNGEGANSPPDLMSLVNVFAVGTGVDCSVPSEFDLAPVQGGNIQVQQ